MRNKIIIILLLTIFSLSECKKTNTDFSGAKVQMVHNMKAGYTDTYTYGSDGNVTLVQRTLGDKTVFVYNGNVVAVQSISGGSVPNSETDYVINGLGCADTSFGKYQAQYNTGEYSYDSNNQLVEQKSYSHGTLVSISDYTLLNKNQTSLVVTTVSNNTHTYYYYNYDLTTTSTIGNENYGKAYLGYGSLNTLKTQVQLNDNNDTVSVITYVSRFDGNSNIDSVFSHDKNGNLVDSLAFTYY